MPTQPFPSGHPQRARSVLSCALAGLGVSLAACGSERGETPLFAGLGDHHHEITTESPLAQEYFDQGLRLVYGFNHDEAIRSFQEAIRLDPECAMCYWGVALANGPNINAAMEDDAGLAAFEAIGTAMRLREGTSEGEVALIEALSARYGPDPRANRPQFDSAYATAMMMVSRQFPDDPDAGVLHAAALMNLSPWNYWTAEKEPRPGTSTLLGELERVQAAFPGHAGACHYYIHAVEAAEPERGIPCADKLPDLMPEAGHIVHMPTHIYIRVGRWADAVARNHHATDADERYIHAESPRGAYPLAYYPHNYDMLSFAASMAGMSQEAMDGARNTSNVVDQTMLEEPGLGALQHYIVAPVRTMVRFGLWEQVLAEPAPPGDLPYPMGTWHFARGMALASTGDSDAARAEREALVSVMSDPAIAEVSVWGFNPALDLLSVADHMLAARIAEREGDLVGAENHLRTALELESQLTYDEPPDWPLPVGPYLGSVLLASGKAAEAEAVFRADLEQWRGNGFSLRGLALALEALGRDDEALVARGHFEAAWIAADVELAGAVF